MFRSLFSRNFIDTRSKLQYSAPVILAFVVCSLYYKYFMTGVLIPVEGYFDPKFKRVADKFREYVWSGASRGCAVAIYHRGKLVVDLWGGYADHEFKIPWRNYTLANVASVTKGMAAFAVAVLVQRGQLNYSRLVSDYWPEFGQNGKQNISVDMLLSHQAGLGAMEPQIPLNVLLNWVENTDKIDALLEMQVPLWPPGSRFGYSPFAYGLYIDALIRHADPHGRTASQFFHDEISIPYGIDFHIGLPYELFYRKARSDVGGVKISWFLDALRSMRYFKLTLATFTNQWYHQSVKIVSGKKIEVLTKNDPEYAAVPWVADSGYGTANAIAKLFFHLTRNDSNLLSVDTIERLSEPLVSGTDSVLDIDVNFGRGLWTMKNALGEDIVGHTGYGGNIAFADRPNELSFAYVTNDNTIYVFGGDPKVTELQRLLYACIK